MHFDLLNLIKMVGASIALGVGTDVATNTLISSPHLNISVTTVVAALLGSGVSFCFGSKAQSTKESLMQVFASSVFGIAVGLLLAEALNLQWAKNNLGLYVLLASAMVRWFLPNVVSRVQYLINEYKLPERGE